MPPLIGVLLLCLLIGLPGIPAAALIASSDPKPDSQLLQIFLSTSLGLVMVGLWGILLASVGHFEPVWVAIGCASMSLLLWAAARRSGWQLNRPKLPAWDGAVLGLLVIVALVFARPHENVIVGRDPGVYTNAAIHLTRSGEWVINDPFFADLPTRTQEAFISYVAGQGPFRLPGFFWIPEDGQALSQFLPFYTVWMALLEWVLGPGGGSWAALLFTIVGGLGLAGFATVFWKPLVGVFVLLLLLCNPAAIWYARSANSEVALQVLLLLITLLWMRRQERSLKWAGPLFMAATLAAAMLDKLDVFYLVPILATVAGLDWLRCPKSDYHRRTALLSLLAVIPVVLYMWRFNLPYLQLTYNLMFIQNRVLVILAIGMILSLGLVFVVGFTGSLRQRFLARYRGWVEHFDGLTSSQFAALVLALVALFVVLYLVLPATVPAGRVADRRLSLLKVGWYVTPMGFVLAGLGALALFLKRPPDPALLLLALCITALSLNLLNYATDHIFAIRRFVVLAIPGLLLFSAGGLDTLINWRPRCWPMLGGVLAVALGGTMALGQAANSQVLLLHREFAGARQTLQTIADHIPARSVTVLGDHDSLLGTFLGPNLWLAHDLEPLYAARPLSADDWQSVYQSAQLQSRLTFYVGAALPPCLPGVDRIALKRLSWHLPALERTFGHFPERVEGFDFEFTIWQLLPGSGILRYEAESLLSQVGSARNVGSVTVLRGSGEPGYLNYGPYHQFPPGRYVARFWLHNEESITREVRIDITPFEHSPLAQVDSSLLPTSAPQPVELFFAIEADAAIPLELRVFLPKGGVVSLAAVDILPLGNEP